jgi:glycine cleavage system H protein
VSANRQPDKLLYAKTHEWVAVDNWPDGRVATIGISAFAVEALTDLVYMELPEVGRTLAAGESFGEIESVKAVSDLYSPVSGEVIAVNEDLASHLERLNADPYGAGWIVQLRLSPAEKLEGLMDRQAYEKQCAEQEH